MTHKLAETLKVGDVIMPPPRELRLWMRRTLQERGLPESALHQTIINIEEGSPDKRGRWLIITAIHSPEWSTSGHSFRFRVRPETPWAVV